MRLYRYLDRKYADSFFADGSLMISTLGRCRQFESADIRGDAGEGTFRSVLNGRNSQVSRTIDQTAAMETMILCCSSIYSEDLHRRFAVDGCIEILNAEAFFDVLTECMPSSCISTKMGPVQYLDERVEHHTVEEEHLLPPPVAIPRMLAKIQALISAGQFTREKAEELSRAANGFPDSIMKTLRRDAVFCKPAFFKEESEVRMTWSGGDLKGSSFLAKCPKAVGLCRRLTGPAL